MKPCPRPRPGEFCIGVATPVDFHNIAWHTKRLGGIASGMNIIPFVGNIQYYVYAKRQEAIDNKIWSCMPDKYKKTYMDL